MSVCVSAIVAAITSVAQPMIAPAVLRGGRQFEEGVHARDQVHPGGHHRRGVDQRGHGSRALHRVGEPRVQRHLRRLGERAHEQQQAAGDHVSFAA